MSGYTFHHATAKDNKQILDFLNEHFVPYEPMNCAINLCEVGYRWADLPQKCFKERYRQRKI
jgi:hypothetical protein